MARKPSDTRLPDHNTRVRRWVKDFDDIVLHPILLVLGYGVDLDDSTYKYNNVTIARGMARYRAGKVPTERTVQRQLRKLEALGIVKADPKFKPSGREDITHRIVDFRQAVRFGQPVEHLWDAPVAEDVTPHVTFHVTPGVTPDVTPSLSSTISELSRLAALSSSDTTIAAEDNPSIEEEEAAGYNNSYFVGTSRKHPDGYFRPAEDAPRRGETRVDLSVDEARFMWVNLRNDDRTRAHRDRLAFLNGSASARAILGYGRDAGPCPPARAGKMSVDQAEEAARVIRDARMSSGPGAFPPDDQAVPLDPPPLSRAEREELYGPSPWTIIRPASDTFRRDRRATFEEERRRYLSRSPEQKQREYAEYRRQMDEAHR